MSKVYVKKKSVSSPIKKVLCAFTGVVLSIVIFTMIDADGYLFLLGYNTSVGSMIMNVIHQVATTFGIETTTTTTADSVGTKGVNTLLIAKMENGYAKDYLTIALQNQNGELDTTKWPVYASISTVIGINVSESNFYKIEKAPYTLPTSDIPVKYITDGTYGSGNVSLYKWSKATATSHHVPGVGGAFAYTPGTGASAYGWTNVGTESIYNKGTTTYLGGKGDAYLFPDAVCGLNRFLNNALTKGLSAETLAQSQYYDTEAAMLTAFTHNVGSGSTNALYGLFMWAQTTDKYVKIETQETHRRLDIVAKDILNGMNRMTKDGTDEFLEDLGAVAQWTGSEICLLSQGWYLDPAMESHILQYSTTAIKQWNLFNPDDKVSTTSQLKRRLDEHTKSLPEATGLSTTECDEIYGTRNGTYSDAITAYDAAHPQSGPHTSQKQYGVIFKIIDGDSSIYKKGDSAKPLIAFSGIPMMHMFSAAVIGPQVFKKMLIYAGVDPGLATADSGLLNVNADSSANVDNTDIKTVKFKADSKWLDKLQSHGCNIWQLDESRYKILVAAMKMEGSRYVWGGSHDGNCGMLTHSTYDCSSYVGHAVIGSEIPDISKKLRKKWPGSTSGFPRSDTETFSVEKFSNVGKDNLYPADICCAPGHHVLLFVGLRNGSICTLEAMSSSQSINGFHTRRSIDSDYYIYRLKDYYVVNRF